MDTYAQVEAPGQRRYYLSLAAFLASLALLSIACAAPTPTPTPTTPARAYIVDATENAIVVVDLKTREIVGTYREPKSPHGGTVSADGRWAFARGAPGSISVFDTQKMAFAAPIQVPEGKLAYHFRPHPAGRYVYYQESDGPMVGVIDTTQMKVVGRFQTTEEGAGYHLFVDPAGKRLFVSNKDDTLSVFAIDAEGAELQPLGRLPIGKGGHHHITTSPDGRTVYVANGEDNSVTVVDPANIRVIATIQVGGKGPHGIALSRDGKRLFTANSGDGTVSVISTQDYRVIQTLSFGVGHMHMHRAPDGLIWFTNKADHKLRMLDPETLEVVKELPLTDGHQIGFFPLEQ